MDRLISADKFEHWINNQHGDKMMVDYYLENLHNQPTVKAIPLDKVKQAKEEIESIGMGSYLEFMKEIECNDREVRMSKKFATAILDKLMAEN